MSLASVTAFFATHAPDIAIERYATSTATVALAAEALGVVPGQIAKTLSLRLDDEVVLLVTRGDARLDNRKYKERFGQKARMLGLDEVEHESGHPVGGVCPFGLARPLRVFCDVSLRAFDVVFPAAGAPDAAVRMTPERLAVLTQAAWVDVAQDAAVVA
jgi:prolyl-tRNA editing enzyme YbaK/EbsC (Cys-tRNA(Pro) deacylase)